MANEISVSINASLANGGLADRFRNSIKVDQANQGVSKGTHDVTTSDTAIPLGTITTLGWLLLENLDDTNFVDYGPDNASALVPFGRLEPGEIAAMRLTPGITPRWQADTATVKVAAAFYED